MEKISRLLEKVLSWTKLLDRMGDPWDESIMKVQEQKSIKEALLDDISKIITPINTGTIKISEIFFNEFFKNRQEAILENVNKVLSCEEIPKQQRDELKAIFYQR